MQFYLLPNVTTTLTTRPHSRKYKSSWYKDSGWIIRVKTEVNLTSLYFPLKYLSLWGSSSTTPEAFDLHRKMSYWEHVTQKHQQNNESSPQRKSSCPRQQRSVGRYFSFCQRHWHRRSRTLRGPASLLSTLRWFAGNLLDAAYLRTAVRSVAAAHPQRSGSEVPCREGAVMSHRARYACWDYRLWLEEITWY